MPPYMHVHIHFLFLTSSTCAHVYAQKKLEKESEIRKKATEKRDLIRYPSLITSLVNSRLQRLFGCRY